MIAKSFNWRTSSGRQDHIRGEAATVALVTVTKRTSTACTRPNASATSSGFREESEER